MDLYNISENIGAFFGGGILMSLVTWRATLKSAEADAMEKVQLIYRNLTEDLVSEIDRLKTEVELLRREVNTLTERAGAACYRHLCVSRIFEKTDNILQIESNEENDTQDTGRRQQPA